jgi:hypothetical protein
MTGQVVLSTTATYTKPHKPMSAKPIEPSEPQTPRIFPNPEKPDDGFPQEKDVSIPPPESDVNTGKHKKEED